ncbi:hypothetical protein QE443_002661 [Pantoea ananatis]|uniref:hypothetical protein n=1 Tax=Pantoea ananas TaxID=553 RepID=UPI0027897E0E|nr:hypothetical protein [Pantoea ananatis]MDQ1226500.1 hypothetical protein [Pantoea ananatis]MDR6088378.1 hypothetical protein [Pantoea ananatis]
MKERPILLNAEMVRAVLDGRKTQTRRGMKVQPDSSRYGLRFITESFNNRETGKYFWSQSDGCGINKPRSKPFSCPFGAVGDRLWVRETFMDLKGTGIESTTGQFEGFAYRADTPSGSYGDMARKDYGLKWTPSLHMPRKASRITLEITGVRVERLQDINHEDSYAEGIHTEVFDQTVVAKNYCEPDAFFQFWSEGMDHFVEMDELYRKSFGSLWSSIYGEESWQANPWVWVIEFKKIGGQP